jgi:hypothetical protein
MRGEFMSKLLQVLGALFLLAGIAVIAMLFGSPGQMQVLGLTPEVAAVLLVGGALTLGIGSLLAAVIEGAAAHPELVDEPTLRSGAAPVKPAVWSRPEETDRSRTVATGAAVTAMSEVGRPTPGVAETINALEQAKTDIAMALGIEQPSKDKEKPSFSIVPPIMEKPAPSAEKPAPTVEKPTPAMEKPAPAIEKPAAVSPPHSIASVIAPPPPPARAAAEEDGEEADDPDLYVVEEKVIRGRPARVLSDGTVEAETDEGWMRFENLEHLDEYLEAMAP